MKETMMSDKLSSLPAHLMAATESLAETLLHAGPILAYQSARARYDADSDARRLMEDLAQAQSELRRRQAQSTINRDLMERVQILRKQVVANAVVMDYVYAERVAVAFLPEVNQQISELLGVNYAAFGGRVQC
jgi:cell fate (sporulation/competence/biofilm development) regulator YlbF (YheA/YmcA/DUF963 family)